MVSWYLDYLIDHTFQASNRLLVLLFENFNDRTVHIEYFLTTVDIKEWNVLIDGQNFFDQPVKI